MAEFFTGSASVNCGGIQLPAGRGPAPIRRGRRLCRRIFRGPANGEQYHFRLIVSVECSLISFGLEVNYSAIQIQFKDHRIKMLRSNCPLSVRSMQNQIARFCMKKLTVNVFRFVGRPAKVASAWAGPQISPSLGWPVIHSGSGSSLGRERSACDGLDINRYRP